MGGSITNIIHINHVKREVMGMVRVKIGDRVYLIPAEKVADIKGIVEIIGIVK